MNNFYDWDPSKPNQVSYTFTSSELDTSFVYNVNVNNNSFSITPDLEAIYDKADKEFDAMEDQTSIARQMLSDIGITWNDKE